ncbi:MAG TPA: ferritin-like domain-containing protein [Polyangiaceae bacterium]|nr:ferritin-like domain-containing protein [Polyangiaceae bacterium]
MTNAGGPAVPDRETLVHLLYEAAELEHNLMCTYLYAAFSLRSGTEEGLTADEAPQVEAWRRAILSVAIDEMGHLAAVWNITAALGGAPRFGRDNFPLDAGHLPARLVVKLAPFGREVLQHFVHLERPHGSDERDGEGFEPPTLFARGLVGKRLTPMPVDYDTVGDFYEHLSTSLAAFVAEHGESAAFVGDPAFQLSPHEIDLTGAQPVLCSKTALNAFRAIVEQGEGAPADVATSHFQRFSRIAREFDELVARRPEFSPAFPAAHNPVLRPPMGRTGRVWIENVDASRTVDVANTCYALMLRLVAYSYVVPRPHPDKQLALDLGIGLMRAMSPLGELAARMPAGPSNPQCNAGMSFTALRESAALPAGAGGVFFKERLKELLEAARELTPSADGRTERAVRVLGELLARAERGFASESVYRPATGAASTTAASTSAASTSAASTAAASATSSVPTATGGTTKLPMVPTSGAAELGPPPVPERIGDVDYIAGRGLTLVYEGKRCIHARFCVTGAPGVFMANVVGPWIRPDAVSIEQLVEIAHACPSGAIRYERKDGHADEAPPLVNLLSIRENGPYAVRADMNLAGKTGEYRATLCRCGASKNKPYCDGSHHDAPFVATGEPPTTTADMLPERGGVLTIDPETDGPLSVRGNLEITSGTGRVVARLTRAKLCRCGGSANKPFCDGTHARIGFRST